MAGRDPLQCFDDSDFEEHNSSSFEDDEDDLSEEDEGESTDNR